jgi:hypothetical protein
MYNIKKEEGDEWGLLFLLPKYCDFYPALGHMKGEEQCFWA